MIADDCQVTKWNGDESAGKAAGVLLNSYIVRVNDTPVTLKKEIVSLIQVRRSMHQDCLLKPRNFVFYPFFTHFPPFFAHFHRLDARNPENTTRSPGENGKKSRRIGEKGGN